MIPPEVATLRDILLGMVTNNESQALGWAQKIITDLGHVGLEIAEIPAKDDLD